MNNRKEKSKAIAIKKTDIWLFAGILAVAVVMTVVIQLGIKKPGETAVITVDGKVVKELPLSQDTKEIEIEGYQGGINKIVVSEGWIYMSYADCPDELCVHTGKIRNTGETIVCLPHRVVVEIKGGEEVYDSVVQ
ncbi:MAG: NusG domain II-containing protein [Lachnospira sp.]|nr:NusG domain II-containing protein [Lachnospira sp.]